MDWFRGNAEIRLHVTSTLTHSVNFSLLDIEIFLHGSFADNGGDR